MAIRQWGYCPSCLALLDDSHVSYAPDDLILCPCGEEHDLAQDLIDTLDVSILILENSGRNDVASNLEGMVDRLRNREIELSTLLAASEARSTLLADCYTKMIDVISEKFEAATPVMNEAETATVRNYIISDLLSKISWLICHTGVRMSEIYLTGRKPRPEEDPQNVNP